MGVISLRLDDADHQKLLVLAEQEGTTAAGIIRKYLSESEAQNRIASVENRLENIEETLSEINRSNKEYLHDLFKVVFRIEMILHKAMVAPNRTKKEKDEFYKPIHEELEKCGYGDLVTIKGGE